MKKVLINTEYIKLGQFLKFTGVVFSGSECKEFIEKNAIKVNGKEEKQRGKKLFSGDFIEINNQKYLIEMKNDFKNN